MVDVRALVKTVQGPGGIELREVTLAEPGPGDVLLAVAAAGICGTDLHIQDGEWAVDAPVIMGHEVSGTVTRTGPGVDRDWLGQRVMSEVWYSTDDTCEECVDGHRNLCARRRSLGSRADGAFATALVVPARNLHRLPENVSLHEGALVEPLACVVGALDDPPLLNAGDRVLVTGPGAIGLLAAQVAAAHGADVVVIGTPRDGHRLAIAETLGFTVSDNSTATELSETFDTVLECSGSASGAELCLAAAKRRSRYVQLGIFGSPVNLTLDAVCLKQLTITSGFGASPSAIRRALRLVERGQVTLRTLITDIVPLAEWDRAFEESRAGIGVKYLLDPNR